MYVLNKPIYAKELVSKAIILLFFKHKIRQGQLILDKFLWDTKSYNTEY